MKKKGYTLIELVVVMAILSILLGSGFAIIKTLKHIKSQVEVEDAIYEVHSILSYAKTYCRKNLCDGEVIIDTVENSIGFKYRDKNNINNKLVGKSEKFPDNIKISANFKPINLVNVSDMGYLKNSGTIFINDGEKQYKITIAVGNDTVTVKEDKEIIDEIEKSK